MGVLAALFALLANPVAGLFVPVGGDGYLCDWKYAKFPALTLSPIAAVGLTPLLFLSEGEQPCPSAG